MKHLMIDIETLGVTPFSAVLSVAAVKFDPATGEIGDSFYVNIDRDSSVALGLMVDEKVEEWWTAPARAEAWQRMQDERVSAERAAEAFCDWFRRNCDFENTIVWSHGAAFDFPILESYLRIAGQSVPWNFRNIRDDRTLFAVADVDFASLPKEGTYHDAMSDAVNQAKAVSTALAKIEELKEKAWKYDGVSD